jgi:hypothetical protein
VDAFLSSGRIIDVILVLMTIEAAALWVLWRRGRVGLPPAELASTLLSGVCLMLAVRGALTGAGAAAVVVPLMLAMVAHLGDLWIRWRR